MAGKRPLISDVVEKLPQPAPAVDAEQVTKRTDGDNVEARSVSRTIRTVEDLLAHIEADLERFEVAASEATKWEGMTADKDTGRPVVTELFRVFVRLKPRGGPTTREIVEGMIAAAADSLRVRSSRTANKPSRKATSGGLWQVLVVSDVHFGSLSWEKTTGHSDYDLDHARTRITDVTERLLDVGDTYAPALRTIAFLGDVFHFDTPAGTTTSGTPMERDGRLQKVLNVAADCLLNIVERSADAVPTEVLTVNGNHDEVLSWAWQRILVERFRDSKRVNVRREFTGRQYLTHGKNLLGFTHGHRAKKKLPQIMALERPKWWSESVYREWHTGHLHHQAAENNKPLDTLDGVIVRTAPTVCPPDDWHSVNGFIGARQACETFLYEPDGGLTAMHVAGVRPQVPA